MLPVKAYVIRVRGIVQGVGFRPFVYRLARTNALTGWVLNGEQGVEIHVEGDEARLNIFLRDLKLQAPPAAAISEIEVDSAQAIGFPEFEIRSSERREHPTVRISPDLAVCEDCLTELADSKDRRHQYPYINCTNCGPRYSVVVRLPYDRCNTTMAGWPLDEFCSGEYHDPANRRFHAQPVACPECGPTYFLHEKGAKSAPGNDAIRKASQLLRAGSILAVKGIGGYHLACDALNPAAIQAMRERKFRKEKPFAVMVRNLDLARSYIELSAESEALLCSVARPIVLAPAKVELEGVAPDNRELGLMLPYTPLHYLLFDCGAPEVLVMTSANRSSEPIAYEDTQALEDLSEIADAFLVGERPIARRVDDSVARHGVFGPVILRRSRGYAPGAVAELPTQRPILAVGPDLKNTITLVVNGQAFVSQHIGDLSHFDALRAFRETIQDLVSMYEVSYHDLLVVHDCHPQYASTQEALELPGAQKRAIQHHRAHIASVLAERGEWHKRVLGISFDGTGYGDDGGIWGGEIFVGSVAEGFQRVGHLRQAALPGGDAAARYPVQAAAGFLSQIDDLPDLTAAPFNFPGRYRAASDLVRKGVRAFGTTSIGRLFDTVAALLGFTRSISYEGQAAIWVEQLARTSSSTGSYPFRLTNNELDFRDLLRDVVADRKRGVGTAQIARRFQRSIAEGMGQVASAICEREHLDTIVLSGGVFQNELLLEDFQSLTDESGWTVWTNHAVPPNDGGISLGQAALAAFDRFDAAVGAIAS